MAVAAFALGYGADALPLLFILLINQVLVQLILFLRSNISGLGFYTADSLLSALDKLLMLLTCGAILWGHVWPLEICMRLGLPSLLYRPTAQFRT